MVVVAVLTSGWQLIGLVRHQRRVEDDRDPRRPVVDEAEGGDRARRHAERLDEEFGLPKESRPDAPIRLMQALQVDRRLLASDDEEERVLLVLEEQVLGVGARDRRRGAPGFPRR